ncbi:hypothetical protein AB6A40_006269 [Gnathostoma spinigerum]|uniref:Uncharacterized protein n=1 Tax=Gnathostoma spinigerum TaxID=75299 RepID=A0ABD6ETJ0_9BILA
MNGSWDADAMASSNATFTITKGNQCEYQFLDEIEFPANLIDIEEDSVSELSSESPSENRMNSTVTLEESRFDPNHLPIVEDDASTPLIEYCPFLESSADNFSVTMPLTSPVLPTATSPSRPTSSNSKMSISSGDSSNHLDSKTTSAPSKKPIEIVPKKPKHQSIREIQNAPLPKRTLKPKPPSKSQIMMERLKASIAADKQKPKKEIKSRLGELLSAPTPVSSDINRDCRKNTSGEKEAGKRASSPTVKRRKPEPLKPNNNKINEEQAASNSSSKQRQSHLPPPKGTSKLSKPNTASRPVTKFVPPNSVSAQKSSSDENKAKSSRLLSASEMNEHSSGTKCVRKTNTEMRDEKSSMTEEEKHRRLKHAVDGFDVLGVLFNYMTTSMEKLLNKNSALEHQLFEQNRERQKQLENVISSFKEQLDEKTNRFETEVSFALLFVFMLSVFVQHSDVFLRTEAGFRNA